MAFVCLQDIARGMFVLIEVREVVHVKMDGSKTFGFTLHAAQNMKRGDLIGVCHMFCIACFAASFPGLLHLFYTLLTAVTPQLRFLFS